MFTIAKLSIRKLGSSSVLIKIIIINLRGASTKLYFNLIFTMQTYKELMFLYLPVRSH